MKKTFLFLVFLLAGVFWAGAADVYEKVTKESQLLSGDECLIIYANGNQAMSTTQNTNNRGATTVTISNNQITTVPTDASIVTFTYDSTNSCWTLYATGSTTGYLYGVSGKNQLKTGSSVTTDYYRWTISWNSNVPTITNKGASSYKLQYNKSSKIFACYSSSTQEAIAIYRKVTPTTKDYTPTFDAVNLTVGQSTTLAPTEAVDGAPTITYAIDSSTCEDSGASYDVVTLDGAKLTAVGGGTATIKASWDANDTYSAGSTTFDVTSNKKEFTYSQDDITISIGEQYHLTFIGDVPELAYISLDDNYVAVNEEGTITGVAATTEAVVVMIDLAKIPDPEWKISETITVKVNVLDQQVEKTPWEYDFRDISLCVGDNYAFDFGSSYPKGSIAFKSDNEDVAMVDGATGEITARSAGAASIKVSWGDDQWENGEATFEVTVNNRDFNPTLEPITLRVGETQQILFESETLPQIKYYVDVDKITVSDDGLITAEKAGEATVYFEWSGDGWNSGSAQLTVTVTKLTFSINLENKSLNLGETYTISCGENAPEMQFTSDNEEVATVADGVVTAIGAGTANITAAWGDDDKWEVGDATFAVEVSNIITDKLTCGSFNVSGTAYTDASYTSSTTGIKYSGKLAAGNSSIQLNTSYGIVVTSNPGYILRKVEVDWNSYTASGRKLYIYGNSAAYTAYTDIKNGELIATITNGTSSADIESKYNYSNIGFTSSGAVYLNSVTLYWEKMGEASLDYTGHGINDEYTMTIGETLTLPTSDEDYPAISYSLAEGETHISLADGVLTALAATEADAPCQVTATWDNLGMYKAGSKTFNVNVAKKVYTYTSAYTEESPLQIAAGTSAEIEFEDGDKPEITYTVSTENASAENGVITAITPGNAVVTLSWGDDTWADGSATIYVEVANGIFSHTYDNVVLLVGETHQLAYGEDEECPEEITYTLPDETTFATISESGLITAVSTGKATVTVNWSGKEWASGSATFTVSVASLQSAGLPLTDELTADGFGIPSAASASYADYSYTSTSTGIKYAGTLANVNGNISLRSKNSNEGIYTTENPGLVLKSVTATWAVVNYSGTTLNVYLADEAFSKLSDLYADDIIADATIARPFDDYSKVESSASTDATYTPETEKQHLGIRSASNAEQFSKVTIEWSMPQPAMSKDFANNGQVGDTKTWTVTSGIIKVVDGTPSEASSSRQLVARSTDNLSNWTYSEDGKSATYTVPANEGAAAYYIYNIVGTNVSSAVGFGTGSLSGINGIMSDADSCVEYYNLQGVKVGSDNLTPGLYIRRQGNTATKVLIK